jgi:endogenous inhibitor of DNA gyrase (YacG/DUF329 family)
MSRDEADPAFRCPTCGAGVGDGGAHRPFCSDRCRRVDLGAWLLGHYRIPVRVDVDEDGADAAPGAAPPASRSPDHGTDRDAR